MAEPKDGASFFRKVVRFVANPATDWTELEPPGRSARASSSKSELKAMVERKRRNDFVRKREFDMLRKLRREGLSPEQLAALGGSSKLDDSEARLSDSGQRPHRCRREGQDRRDRAADGGRRLGAGRHAASRPASTSADRPAAAGAARRRRQAAARAAGRAARVTPPLPPLPERRLRRLRRWRRRAGVRRCRALPPLAPLSLADAGAPAEFEQPFAVEVSEVAHDPELDEAVIAFANADFNHCEQALRQLIGAGRRARAHAETWLVLFDLYRPPASSKLREPGAGLRAAVRLVVTAVVLAAQAGRRCGGRRRQCRTQQQRPNGR